MDLEEMFEGFDEPRSNYSKLPHQFINVLPDIKTLGEMKVILYVLRHTWGFGDDEKKITMDEFMYGRKRKTGERYDNGTGLSEPTLRAGIQQAVEDGFLDVETDDHDKARIKKIYSLRERNLPPEGKELTPNPKETLPRTEKETIDRNNRDSGDEKTTSPTQEAEELYNAMKSQSDGYVPQEHTAGMVDPRKARVEYQNKIAPQLAIVLAHSDTSKTDISAAGKLSDMGFPQNRVVEWCKVYSNGRGDKYRKPMPNGERLTAYHLVMALDDWRKAGYYPLDSKKVEEDREEEIKRKALSQ